MQQGMRTIKNRLLSNFLAQERASLKQVHEMIFHFYDFIMFHCHKQARDIFHVSFLLEK